MNHIYQTVPGWFDWQGIYSRWAEQVSDRGRIVEVGNYHGRSLSYLLVELANRGRSDVNVIGVDPFIGGDGIPDGPEDIERGFNETIARLGDAARPLRHMKMPSVLASSAYLDLTIDFVWIDGDHHFTSVLEDLEAWWPKVKLGGEMGGHDYAWPGVTDALRVWTQTRGITNLEVVLGENSYASWLIRK